MDVAAIMNEAVSGLTAGAVDVRFVVVGMLSIVVISVGVMSIVSLIKSAGSVGVVPMIDVIYFGYGVGTVMIGWIAGCVVGLVRNALYSGVQS